MSRFIAMLTDFGQTDIYVGVMKGVIRTIAPDAHFIDITHAIQPQNVRQGAFALLNSYRYFPKGTIFLCVVDPGVGTTRRPIAVNAGNYMFVAPDNGLLTYVLHEIGQHTVTELTEAAYRLPRVSATFHGRDVFAPAVAHLAQGVAPELMGPPVSDVFMLPLPDLRVQERHVSGEIVHIDHFGNIITSIGELRWITADRLALHPRFGGGHSVPVAAGKAAVRIGAHQFDRISRTYDEVPRGELLALVGSSGYLEIAANQGNAAERLDVVMGDPVEVALGAMPVTGRLSE